MRVHSLRASRAEGHADAHRRAALRYALPKAQEPRAQTRLAHTKTRTECGPSFCSAESEVHGSWKTSSVPAFNGRLLCNLWRAICTGNWNSRNAKNGHATNSTPPLN
eukprot:4613917-Pleurochrysis_carterae.AAC.1